MDTPKVGPFEVIVTFNNFSVNREKSSVSLNPGEGDSAISILKHAVSMVKRKVLPPEIKHTPFKVNFTKERVMYLSRVKSRDAGVAFTFQEGQDLIEAVKAGVDKMKDITTIGEGKNKKGFFNMPIPDPLIDGR